jgi:hypothetical protein
MKTRAYMFIPSLSREATENILMRFCRSSSSNMCLALEEVLLLSSLELEVAGNTLEATHPSFAFHRRSVRSLDNVHVLRISVGHE